MGLGAAFEYLETIGLDAIRDHESDLLGYAAGRVAEVKGLRLVGTAAARASVLSFVMEGVHPHDVGQVLDAEGIAIRAGHHCAQPVMERLGVPATARASFGLYNTRGEVDLLVRSLHRVRELFS
jgi:cysteine desulfurase/selenocysteine lyase